MYLWLLIVTCIAHDTFLLVSDFSNLSMVRLDAPELSNVILPLAHLSAVGLDVDTETDSIFWTDITSNTINTARTDVSIINIACVVLYSAGICTYADIL